MLINSMAPLMCAAGVRGTNPITEYVNIKAEDGGSATFTTYDLEKGVRRDIECTIFEGGNYWSGSVSNYKLPEMGIYEKKEDADNEEIVEEKTEEAEERERVAISPVVIFIPVASGLAVIIFIYFSLRIASKIRFKKLEASKQFVAYSKQLFSILRLLGKPIKEDETLFEYKTRLEKDYYSDRLLFIDELEKYLYSGRDVKDELSDACKGVIKWRKELLGELRKKHFVKYILYCLKYNY